VHHFLPPPLWASLLKDNQTKTYKQENHQGTTLIVLKNYFAKLINKSGDQKPLKKRGETEKPDE
jgi:hypothetical protein